MNSKRKLLISVLVIMFVVIAIVSTIAIIFAATQQNITTNLNINYTAENIDATVSATMSIAGGEEESLGSVTFKAEDESGTGSLSPTSDVTLTSTEKYVTFKYTFQNTGDNAFVAMFDYEDTDTTDSNMKFSYKGEATSYKENANAVLVNGGETKTYYVQIEIDNLARNAHLSGAINWDMTSDIIVATPDTAQEVLDTDINGKTVVFDEGTYTGLNFNQSLDATSAIYYDKYITGTGTRRLLLTDDLASFDMSNLDSSTSYFYERNISDITFAGIEGSSFTGEVNMNSNSITDSVDPFKGTVSSYTNIFNVNGLTFTGMDFVGNSAKINLYSLNSILESVTINNCSFVNNDEILTGPTNAAIYIMSIKEPSNCIRNIEIKGNTIRNYYMGTYVGNADNALIEFNNISNTSHNAIAVQTSDAGATEAYYFSGNIEIYNNKISNIGDRAIRFGVGYSASIIIENNQFSNCLDGTSLLKSQTSYQKDESVVSTCEYTFTNNIYEGVKLENTTGSIDINNNWEYVVD